MRKLSLSLAALSLLAGCNSQRSLASVKLTHGVDASAGGDAAYIVTTPTATYYLCLLYTSPSPRDKRQSRMPSSA